MVLITNFPIEGSKKKGAFHIKIEDESQWFEKENGMLLFKGSFWTKQEEKIIETIEVSPLSELQKSLESMNAIFSLIWIDDRSETLTIANDRYGFKSMFYYWNPQTLQFAVSDRYLTIQESIQSIGLAIDIVGIAEFLLFNFPLNEKTFIEGIQRIPMGSVGIFHENDLSFEPYWTPTSISSSIKDLEKAVRDVDNLLNIAIDLIISDNENKEFALGLSGGMDSRLIAAKFVERGVHPSCFVYGNKKSDSFRVSREVATELGIPLKLVEIDPLFYQTVAKDAVTISPMINLLTSWPLASLDQLPQYDILLTGFNGDNMFGSHILSTSLSLPTGDIDSIVKQILRKYGQNGKISDIQQIMIPSVSQQIMDSLNQFVTTYKLLPPWKVIEAFNFSNRQLAFIKFDFMFQSSGAKWISPFMYPPLVDYLNSLDISLKLNLKLFQSYMNEYYPKLFRIRTERSPTSSKSHILKKSLLKGIQLFERVMGTHYLTGETHKKFLLDMTQSNEFSNYARNEFISASDTFRQTIDVNKVLLLLDEMISYEGRIPRKVPSTQFRKLLLIFAALTTKLWLDSLSKQV